MKQRAAVCIVAGKSGGHIIPGMTYAKNIVDERPETDVLFFSTDTSLDRSIVALYPHVSLYVPLPMTGFPGLRVWRYPIFIYQLIRSFFKSVYYLKKVNPGHIISMGGYISIPVTLAARLLSIPVDFFELNAVPGKAVQWLAPLARTIFVCFKEARTYFHAAKVIEKPYPLRFTLVDKVPREEAYTKLGLKQGKKVLLILGGSQGSQSINELMRTFFKQNPEIVPFVQVIHQTGAGAREALAEFYKQQTIEAVVFDFVHDLQYSYVAADLVISRAGAGTLFELEFFNKKALLIPLEHAAASHQVENAQAIIRKHPELFAMIRQEDAEKNPGQFGQKIQKYLF